jgi:hypothetical protein
VDTFEIISRGSGGHAKMAIYFDSGSNTPGNLLTATGAFSVTLPPASVTVSPTTIQPGKYWLAVLFDQDVTLGEGSATIRSCTFSVGSFNFPGGAAWSCDTAFQANIAASGVQ